MALEKWTLKEISSFLDRNSEGTSYYLQVPKFQRKMVWPDDKITKLVDSIYRGYPIGSLLVYQTDAIENNKIVLQLVDGLQRSTSIAKFLKSPLKYAPIKDFVPDHVLERCAVLAFGKSDEQTRQTVFTSIKSWFHGVTELVMGAQYNSNNLAKAIVGDDDDALMRIVMWNIETKEIDVLLGNVLHEISNVINYEVPLNIYQGPIENVPTIFERVNSQGTPLSKYEILAASWITTDLWVTNLDVVSAIRANYSARIANREYEIEGFDENGEVEPGTYNLYEYLFGLGKVLSNQCPTIFPSSGHADEISPIAFQIFTLAYQLPVAKMGQLDKYLRKNSAGTLEIEAAERAILEAANKAEEVLHPFFSFKLNSSEAGVSGIKQNQAISLVTSYIANVFDSEFDRKANHAEISTKLGKNIPSHFLIDLLRDKWSGSGDSTLFERTWSREEDEDGNVSISPSPYYLTPASRSNLIEAFEAWHSEQLDKKQKERVAYPKDFKPVLKFLYAPIVSHFHAKSLEFDLEHIYPIAYLKKIIKADNLEGLAMGAIGNLMLLPEKINRIKKENLLGDWLESNVETEAVVEQLQRYLISPKLDEVKDLGHLTEADFRSFCEMRAQQMLKHIANHIALAP